MAHTTTQNLTADLRAPGVGSFDIATSQAIRTAVRVAREATERADELSRTGRGGKDGQRLELAFRSLAILATDKARILSYNI